MATNSKKSILIVDDNIDIRELLSDQVKDYRSDMDILHAPNGQAAVTALRVNKRNVCLIISDLNMPYMGGVAFIEKVREEMKIDTPVLLISGDSPTKQVTRICMRQDTFFLSKPWTPTELISILSKVIS